jgi:pyruvate/2-oxoglutarate dehydrogenase complex dihydrolipoamide acyltransferase (E2) component
MSIIEVKVPQLSESVAEGTLAFFHSQQCRPLDQNRQR